MTLSPILSAIVAEAFSGHPQFQLVAEWDTRDRLIERLVGLRPDIVVVGLAQGEADSPDTGLLTQLPTARVVSIRSGGDFAYLDEMRPYRRLMVDFSPASLLAAIVAPRVTEIEISG